MQHRGSILGDPLFILTEIIGTVLLVWLAFTFIANAQSTGALPAVGGFDPAQSVIDTRSLFDAGIVLSVVFMGIASALLAWQYQEKPQYFIVGIVALLILNFIYPVGSNILIQAASTSALAQQAQLFTLTIWLIQNLPTVLMTISVVIFVANYGKNALTVPM